MPATLNDIQLKYGESVYPLYKDQMHEPYMENGKGGFQGVVLYDEHEDKIRCEECGKWLNKINRTHLKMHKFDSSKEYKDKYGLNYNVPLQSKKLSQKQSEIAERTIKNNKNFASGWKSHNVMQKAHEISSKEKSISKHYKKIMFKNHFGLCDAQIATRLQIVADSVQRSPMQKDLKKYDYSLLKGIYDRYGNLNNCKKKLGYEIYTGGRKLEDRFTDTGLLSFLREFVIEKHIIPQTRITGHDSGLPSWVTYRAHFGSWRRAKMMAGLDQLLEEVKNG